MPIYAHTHTSPGRIDPFDARGIAERFRHAAMFRVLDVLNRREGKRFVNGHAPIPLLQQMQVRYGGRVGIHDLEQGPERPMIHFVMR